MLFSLIGNLKLANFEVCCYLFPFSLFGRQTSDTEIAIPVSAAPDPNGALNELYDIQFVGLVIVCFPPMSG